MKRKEFIKLTGGLSGGLMLMSGFLMLSGCKSTKSPTNPFGIQLYTLRDVMPTDPKGVLKQLSNFGYSQIESYEGPLGIYWGMSPTEFKSYMDDLEMEIIASHCNIHERFEEKVDQAASIGMKYLICPWIGRQNSLDSYRIFADTFNKCGEICNQAGIKFAYHNHEYTFEELDGVIPQELLLQSTDPDLVDFELDIYWLETAGADTISWLEKYPNRFTLSHVKDRESDAPVGSGNASTTLGTGSINYPDILRVAKQNGMKYFIVEQEKYAGTTSIESSRDNAEYMKRIEW